MAKKTNVPKTIAGVKLPKPLRRGLRELAATQTGRDALTEALDAAGAALAAAAEDKRADGAQPARKAGDGRAAAAQALQEAARSFTETLRRKAAQAAPSPAPAPSGPPPSAVTH